MKKVEINRNNYESWFVDYLEGNLDETVVDRFIEFLQKNPDLKEELKLFESVTAVAEDLTFQPKNKLYKEKYDQENAFNETAVAELEGDLDLDEIASFEKYLKSHPEKQKEKQLFEKTILLADKTILFENKNKLYKKAGRNVFLLWAGRVAAILIIAIAIYTLFIRNSETPIEKNRLAQVEDNSQQKNLAPEIRSELSDVPAQEKNAPDKLITEKVKILPLKKTESLIAENKESVFQEEMAPERIPLEVPKTMNSLSASIELPAPLAEMGVMTIVYPDYIPDDEHLLTDNLRGKVSLQKITRAGLNLVANLSNERFNYETNSEGRVTEFNYESRLLAFSIPAAPNADEE